MYQNLEAILLFFILNMVIVIKMEKKKQKKKTTIKVWIFVTSWISSCRHIKFTMKK